MHEAELAFVEALRDVTNAGKITWSLVDNSEKHIYRADINGEILEVEFMSFPTADGDSAERVVATVSGMKTYFQVAVGTPAYRVLDAIFANKKAWESSSKNLLNATKRVRQLIEFGEN